LAGFSYIRISTFHNKTLSTDISKLVPEEEQGSSQKGKKLTSFLNRTGFGLALWQAIVPYPHRFVLTAALIFPLIVLVVLFINRKSISLELGDKKNPAKQQSLFVALAVSSMVMALRATIDYDLLVFSDCLVAWAVVFVVLIVIMTWIENGSTVRLSPFSTKGLGIVFFVLIYSYGGTIVANCLYDKAEPEIYHTRVLRKHMTGGRSYRFYFVLDKWGPRTKPEDVAIPGSLYRKTQPGDSIDVYVKKGTLGIPWYFVW